MVRDSSPSTEIPHAQGASPAPRRALPSYDNQLSGFHSAFEPELQQVLETLPLTPEMRVLDLACGNGFYARRLADRLGPGGSVTGVDVNPAYIAEARQQPGRRTGRATMDFVVASFDRMPFPDGAFDFAWCAQSLYSLPEPVVALRHLARVVRPGGIVAVLENDTMHQVLLPWPVGLELPVRAAELRALSEETHNPGKYYVGRTLPGVIAAAGLEPLSVATRAIDRQAPLGEPEQAVLQSYLDELSKRVAPYLDASRLQELHRLTDPKSPQHLLRQPYFTMTWLNVLALGRKRS